MTEQNDPCVLSPYWTEELCWPSCEWCGTEFWMPQLKAGMPHEHLTFFCKNPLCHGYGVHDHWWVYTTENLPTTGSYARRFTAAERISMAKTQKHRLQEGFGPVRKVRFQHSGNPSLPPYPCYPWGPPNKVWLPSKEQL